MRTRDTSRPSWGIVLVRLALGPILLVAGWGMVGEVAAAGPEPAAPAGLGAWWAEELLAGQEGWARRILAWASLLAGLGLTFGVLVRPAGVVAALLAAYLWRQGGAEPAGFLVLLAACSLACALSRAGRRLGLDAWLDGALPTWLTWVKKPQGKFDFL